MNIEVVQLASQLIRIPSITEHEYDVLQFLSRVLVEMGFEVQKLEISERRYNIFATRGEPEVCFTTHVDTVPGNESQFVPKIREGRLYGRGACDTKGIIASMLLAVASLPNDAPIAFLFVVGEEEDGIGARIAATHLENSNIKYFVNGEPTEGCLALGHKGGLTVSFTTRGRACHSGYPELGVDANLKMFSLVEKLSVVNGLEKDEVLGVSSINFGLIKGGSASNVVSDSCELEAMIRVVSSASQLEVKLSELVGDDAEISILGKTEPVRLLTLDGFDTIVVSYCSDIPYLNHLNAKFLMYGPGSIVHAHTDSEYVDIDDLQKGVVDFSRIYNELSSLSE